MKVAVRAAGIDEGENSEEGEPKVNRLHEEEDEEPLARVLE